MKQVTVLLTGVGAPGTRGTIYALKNNAENRKVRLIGTDLKDVLGRYWVERFYEVPPPESQEYTDEINRICSRENVDVVLPQTTRETAKLSEGKISTPVTVSPAPATKKANNKFELMNLFRELSLPHPRYFLVKALADLIDRAEELGYPDKAVVVKPPVSHGSRGFRVLRENTSWTTRRFLSEKPSAAEITLDDLSKMLTKDKHVDFPELLVSEFLPGKEYSVDAFLGQKASVAIPRLRTEVVNGISFRTTLEYREDLANYTLVAARALGLKYAFGFQFKLDYSDVPKVLECNPRVQGTMVASVYSGVNVIWWTVKEALGEPPENVPKLKLCDFYRFWGGVGISPDGTVLGEI
ncbi:MAG: ATP-grasp domain-containing protein [Nitrososphaerales archaeon]